MNFVEEMENQVKQSPKTIVFPEGTDARVLKAAAKLEQNKVLKPLLLGNRDEVAAVANREKIDLTGIEILDPAEYPAEDRQAMQDALFQRRKGKNTAEECNRMLMDVSYFATMLVYMGKVDGMVSGAIHSTADTVRPALQIIKTKPGISRISGAFYMHKGAQRYIFTDCAINIELDAPTMAEVAIESAHTAKLFGIDPHVAMLSFSSKGSAKGPLVDKVAEATKLAHTKDPELKVDGELQFDAAIEPAVAKIKVPDSPVAGKANVFVFPSLEAGNIGYKIAQLLGGFTAVGPILQGLNAPVADLSRGTSAFEIYQTAIITAAQAK